MRAAPFPRVRLQPQKLLDGSSTLDNANQDNNDRENQENVDEPAESERGHQAEQPENHENDGNGPKQIHLFLLKGLGPPPDGAMSAGSTRVAIATI